MERPFVFFDLDRTLIDHDRAERKAVRQFHRKHRDRIPEPYDAFLDRWRTVADRYWRKYESGEVDYREQKRERIRVVLNGDASGMSDDEAEQHLSRYLDTYVSFCRLFSDVREVLDGLRKHVRMGILTNGGGRLQRRKLSRTDIDRYFDPVVCSNEAGTPKPNAEIFHHACREAGCSPERITYIGDHPELDVRPARELGMTGVWLNRPGVRAPDTGVEDGVPTFSKLTGFARYLRKAKEPGHDE